MTAYVVARLLVVLLLLGLAALAGLVAGAGAGLLWLAWHRVTWAPRTAVECDQWTTVEDYDVATGSHPSPRGIAPHGLGPKCDHATHSPFVRLSDFDESALRVLVELDNERHGGAA